MSFLSSIKKLGRAVDPTSKTSPLGGLVRIGISAIPGGSAVLEGVNTANGVVRLAPKTSTNTGGAAPTAANAVPAVAGGNPLVSSSNPGTVALLAVGGALVLAYLLFRK